jgi:predicted AAA+ superfamily ATPase
LCREYSALIKNTYQIALLKPWFNNAAKRLVKMPKVFMLDSGILCHLLKLNAVGDDGGGRENAD